MIYLLDINVLLALAWPNHSDHDVASNWIVSRKSESLEIATCALTELGFLRLSMASRPLFSAASSARNTLDTGIFHPAVEMIPRK